MPRSRVISEKLALFCIINPLRHCRVEFSPQWQSIFYFPHNKKSRVFWHEGSRSIARQRNFVVDGVIVQSRCITRAARLLEGADQVLAAVHGDHRAGDEVILREKHHRLRDIIRVAGALEGNPLAKALPRLALGGHAGRRQDRARRDGVHAHTGR